MARGRLASLLASLAAAVSLAAPADADWLVLKDGSRVETRGPWEDHGATLVFHLPNGTFGSVRAADLDREASAAANAPPTPAAAPAETPPPKKPVLVLTDADVAHVEPAPATAEAQATPGSAAAADRKPGSGAAATQKPAERLEVTSWRQDPASAGAVTLIGDVRNISSEVAGGVQVTALIYDEKEKLIATSEAILGANVLQPGQSTNFRASFPGVAGYSSVKFQTKHFAMKAQAQPPAT